jgi:hypothetical protein
MSPPADERLTIRFDRDLLNRIDLVRQPLSRVAWVKLVVEKTLGAHPFFQSPTMRRLVNDLPALGEDLDFCHHPPERVYRDVCGQCGQLTVDLRRTTWKELRRRLAAEDR